ncbi:MAG TPA: hypothetical protein VF282_00775 [Bacillota bacterium]
MRIHYQTSTGLQTRDTTLEDLGATMDEIQRQLLAEGRVAVGVYIGDVLVDAEPQGLAEHLRQLGGHAEDLRVEDRALDELARDAAESARAYMARFLGQAPALVDELYAGTAAPDRLVDLFDGLNWLAQFLDAGLPRVAGPSGPATEAVRAFKGALLRLADLDDVGDTAFLADILAYEILPAVEALDRAVREALG